MMERLEVGLREQKDRVACVNLGVKCKVSLASLAFSYSRRACKISSQTRG